LSRIVGCGDYEQASAVGYVSLEVPLRNEEPARPTDDGLPHGVAPTGVIGDGNADVSESSFAGVVGRMIVSSGSRPVVEGATVRVFFALRVIDQGTEKCDDLRRSELDGDEADLSAVHGEQRMRVRRVYEGQRPHSRMIALAWASVRE
jgi:hypothetical protein